MKSIKLLRKLKKMGVRGRQSWLIIDMEVKNAAEKIYIMLICIFSVLLKYISDKKQ